MRVTWRPIANVGSGILVVRWLPAVVLALAALAVPSQAGTPTGSKARVKQGVKAEVKRGTLRITGNRRADSVTLRLRRRKRGTLEVDVRSNGSADFRFKRKTFKRIVLRGAGGNDTLGISERNGSFFRSERTTLDGGRGRDRLVFTGSDAGNSIALSANGRRLRVARRTRRAAASASFTVAAAGLEHVAINPLGGADVITLGDLTGTGAGDATVELGSASGGDGQADTVIASGTAAGDSLTPGVNGTTRTLGGLPWAFTAANFEGNSDRLIVNGLGGADTLNLSGSDTADDIDVSAAAGLLRAFVAGTVFESDDVEALRVNALGGADALTLNDLAGTDVNQVALDLGSTAGGPADGQVDTLTVNGGGGADNVALTSSPAGIAVSGLAATSSIIAADPGDRLTVNGLGGADTVNAAGLGANVAVLTLRGGPDADTLTGSPGNDSFASDPGGGADVVEGGAGADLLAVNGSNAGDNLALSAPTAGRVLLTRDDAGSTDANDVESADMFAAGGADLVTVGDLSGGDLTEVGIDLASSDGSGDGQADGVIVDATNGADVVTVTNSSAGVGFGGLAVNPVITGAEPGADTLTVRLLGGSDIIDASGLQANVIGLTLEGGTGGEVFIGSQGNDLVDGEDGDDLALLGAGNDTFVWNPGDDNDTIEGQAGADRLLFNGSGANENIDISPNGGRMRFFRDVANVTMDCDDVEIVDFNALGGADTIVVNNTAGTDLSQVNLALAASAGGGDAQPDSVILNGTNGNDVVDITGGPAGLGVSGPMPALAITGAEAANDRLTVNGLAGNDLIDASEVASGAMLLTLNGDAGNDVLLGGDGPDTINGGDNDDFLRGGPGSDILNGGAGVDTVVLN
jgi:hypothetical protein